MPYDKFPNRLFAALYDALDRGVQSGVAPYRAQTAGESVGRALEIGAGTGANLPYFPESAQLYAIEPNPHMRRRFASAAANRAGREAVIVGGVGERLPFADESFDTVVTTLTLCMVSDLDAAHLRNPPRPSPRRQVPLLRTRSVPKPRRPPLADHSQPPLEVRHHGLQPEPRHIRVNPRRRIQPR